MRRIEEITPIGVNEALDRKYENRNLAVRMIEAEIAKKIEADQPFQESFLSLEELMLEWRLGSNVSSYKFFLDRQNNIHNSLVAVMYYARADYVLYFFNRLKRAVDPSRRVPSFVYMPTGRIGAPDGISLDGMQDLYTFAAVELEEARESGIGRGIMDVLLGVESDQVPLLPYNRETAAKFATNGNTNKGNLVVKLPTKVPGIQVQYLYPPETNNAILSTVVNPLR